VKDENAGLVERLRSEGARRYHDHHPFHVAMHEGRLTKRQIQAWVENRYYYQTRIPKKDALVLSKADDPAFRRMWIRRIVDHDGAVEGEGGLAMWLRLADGVGLERARVERCADVLPGVRFACDRYMALVEESPLVVAVASSLTEFFSPDIMSKRVLAWEKHYPWVPSELLEYFRSRVPRAARDSREAIDYVTTHATTPELEEACVAALIEKCTILWALLDAVSFAHGIGP
jgi:pyrroloquinoline-quinone synthase